LPKYGPSISHELRGCLSKAVLAFGRAVLYLLFVFVFCARRAQKRKQEIGSTMLPQAINQVD